MGRKPKLADKEFNELVIRLREINRIQNNLIDTDNLIRAYQDQTKEARKMICKKKKELEVDYRVSKAYINQLLTLISKNARIFRVRDGIK